MPTWPPPPPPRATTFCLQRRHHAQTYTVPFYTGRINTNTGEVFIGTSDVNAWYNSMVLSLRRPMRHGLEFTANYTFSKAIDGAQAGELRHVQWHRLSHRSL
jgi:hypothetical protein